MSSHIVTNDNYGPAVNVITWLLGATALLAVAARVVTKRVLSSIALDDYVILAALIFCLGMSVTTAFATMNGLGQHIDGRTKMQLATFEKAIYAGELLYIMVIVLSKISILYFLRTLTRVHLHGMITNSLGIFVLIWGLAGFIVTLFQCHPPVVWEFLQKDKCINSRIFWSYFHAMNIVIEAAIVIFPTAIVSSLQLQFRRKVVIGSCFVARILVIAAAIPQLIFLNRAMSSADFTFTDWPEALCTQFVQSFSIITACIPYLKPFLASIQTGMIRNDDLRRRGGGKGSGYFDFTGQSHTAKDKYGKGLDSSGDRSIHLSDKIGAKSPIHRTTVEAGDDAASQASQSRMIRQTTTWEVRTEGEP